MDSNSNSSTDLNWAKVEVESDDRSDESYSRLNKPQWNSENTMRLIYILEHQCKELWDIRHPMYKDKSARQARHEHLADVFGTTAEEIVRKLHNLRTQLNNELRKIKRRQSESGDGGTPTSGWEYFDALSFLMRQNILEVTGDPLESAGGVNLALAEFQADEEIHFGAKMKAVELAQSQPKPKPERMSGGLAAMPPLPLNAHPLIWAETKPRPAPSYDECKIFGDFVASELRTLRSRGNRRKLKMIIQKAILEVTEAEDNSFLCG